MPIPAATTNTNTQDKKMSKSQLLIQELQAKIEKLRGLDKLEAKLAEAKEVVSKLEAEIADLTGEAAPKTKGGKRTRVTEEQLKVLEKSVSEIIKGKPISMGEIAKRTGHKPATLRKVLETLKAKKTGDKRSTVYSL